MLIENRITSNCRTAHLTVSNKHNLASYFKFAKVLYLSYRSLGNRILLKISLLEIM